MKIFYHNDLDGRCAGAIVNLFFKNDPDQIEFIELDYKDKVPVERILVNERVIIVDFSFKPEVMEKVLEITDEIVWIDHHKTAFEYKYSGCELAWIFYYPNIVIPRAIQLIGDRDKWAWKFGKETAEVNQGIKLYPHQPMDIIWDALLKPDASLLKIRVAGEICIKYRDQFCCDYADSYGFETEYEGYRCFAMGLYMFGSEAFGDRMDKYDICLSFVFDGKRWTVGLYSKTIDVSQIAKKNGGGGHTGAAGFVCDDLPFKSS